MKKYIAFIFLALSALALSSCKEDESGIERWGEIKSFPDWFLNKYEPVTITRTLNVDFNDDAKADFQRDIVLGLYQVDDHGREIKVRPDQVQLFVNGELSADNELRIRQNDRQIEIGLLLQKAFLEETGPGMYNLKFKVLDNGGLDFINEFEVSGLDELPLLQDNTAMDVYHERGKNVPRVITDTSLITALLALIAVIVLIQIFVPKFTNYQLQKQFITQDGSRRAMLSMNRAAKGSKEIVLTGTRGRSQGLLKLLFQGKTTYVFIKGLPSDITLTPGKKFQTRATFNHTDFIAETAGSREELKVLKGTTKDGIPVEVEFYAKNK